VRIFGVEESPPVLSLRATLALLLTLPWVMPWYVAWLLPLAALGTDRRLFKAALVMTGVVQGIQLLGYIPHAISLLGV